MRSDLISLSHINVENNHFNKESLIRTTLQRLVRHGYINEPYIDELLSREMEYPTGLQFSSVNIAIPHVDSSNVNKSCLEIVKLRNPVNWESMEDPESMLSVNLVFFIILKENDDHMSVLSSITRMISDDYIAKQLNDDISSKELLDILKKGGK